MDDGSPAPGRFVFEVTTTGRISVDGVDARQARDWLVAAMLGASATIASGPASGLKMVDLAPSDDVALLRIDGADPFSALAAAIERYRGRDDAT